MGQKKINNDYDNMGKIHFMGEPLSLWLEELETGSAGCYRGSSYTYWIYRRDSNDIRTDYVFEVRSMCHKTRKEQVEVIANEFAEAINKFMYCTVCNPTDYSKRPRVMFFDEVTDLVNRLKWELR